MQYVKYFTSFQFIEKLDSGKYKLYPKNGTSEEYDFLIWAGHPFDLPNVIYLRVSLQLFGCGVQVLLTFFSLFQLEKKTNSYKKCLP